LVEKEGGARKSFNKVTYDEKKDPSVVNDLQNGAIKVRKAGPAPRVTKY